jgi:hypothetical protein
VELVSGLSLEIISPEDLVLAKLRWAAEGESELQIRDIRNLVGSVDGLDEAYLADLGVEAGSRRPTEKGDLRMSADTSPEIERRYSALIMSRSPQQRVAMCFAMSETARAIARRSLEAAGLTPEEIGPALVVRLYGADLTPAAQTACRERVRNTFRALRPSGSGLGG